MEKVVVPEPFKSVLTSKQQRKSKRSLVNDKLKFFVMYGNYVVSFDWVAAEATTARVLFDDKSLLVTFLIR